MRGPRPGLQGDMGMDPHMDPSQQDPHQAQNQAQPGYGVPGQQQGYGTPGPCDDAMCPPGHGPPMQTQDYNGGPFLQTGANTHINDGSGQPQQGEFVDMSGECCPPNMNMDPYDAQQPPMMMNHYESPDHPP